MLSKNLVIGHVGGFVEQKNHTFLIDVFRAILKSEPSAKLVLIGDGCLRDAIIKSVEDIKDSVLFIGNTDHVEDYLQMMDIMVFPSLFEGLPLVVIEWQINGLMSIVSDMVTAECAVSKLIKFKSLDEGPNRWALDVLKYSRVDNENRKKQSKEAVLEIKMNGFDIKENSKVLRKIYTS